MDIRDSVAAFAIRPLREDELEEMTRLWVEAGLPYRPKGRDSLDGLRTQRSRDPDLFLGAFEGSVMVGVVIATDDGRKGWINRLAVRPRYQKRGIGKALVAACEAALRKRGRGVFSILIEGRNDASEGLFLGAGYKDESYIRYYAKRDSDET